MRSITEMLITKNVLISDGAWGTFLHKRGLLPGECPELWNVTHKNDVFEIAKSYIDAGADLILTNSFGGSPIKLKHYGLEDRAHELNEAAAKISREAAGEYKLVLGSIGPTGVILMLGEVSEESLFNGFQIQANALEKGGVDAICIETMTAIDEACIAIRAVKSVCDLEIVCTFTFDRMLNGSYKTMMGVSPSEMVVAVKEAGASIIGANCGNGFNNMIEIVREIRTIDKTTPILIHANAGKPILENGITVFPETPEMMVNKVDELINCGANIIGGCCGTTPNHIKALVEKIRN
ncbi:MAG: homocysteine S-methyltransferase family protein [Bacteroidetes bacterium]|nr:homocysteine S-methyltransferase family protein [Bacteroidota bacterium]MBU1114981.1 homocysteine S-methyltransferase family protein [Bacteroidota bacterium]MBU1799247.1 homocysteine S-methyltransferase family protein [Bacteroidota bacterium]